MGNEIINITRYAVIVVKLKYSYDRNLFLKSLVNYRKLHKNFPFSLRNIGYNSDVKFYVNNSLMQNDFRILSAVIHIKKTFVFCINYEGFKLMALSMNSLIFLHNIVIYIAFDCIATSLVQFDEL